ncbi:hypothetical protein [Lysobacter sp. CA199]|uniref:hypothetical protein n=1 Tax=Lysobacter sp. CA199 TaxID=3455608 RepID=UPI003F8D0775
MRIARAQRGTVERPPIWIEFGKSRYAMAVSCARRIDEAAIVGRFCFFLFFFPARSPPSMHEAASPSSRNSPALRRWMCRSCPQTVAIAVTTVFFCDFLRVFAPIRAQGLFRFVMPPALAQDLSVWKQQAHCGAHVLAITDTSRRALCGDVASVPFCASN